MRRERGAHEWDETPIAVLAVRYVVLGTALDGISMIVLTSAVVLPMIQDSISSGSACSPCCSWRSPK
jgi:hypothetical protein